MPRECCTQVLDSQRDLTPYGWFPSARAELRRTRWVDQVWGSAIS